MGKPRFILMLALFFLPQEITFFYPRRMLFKIAVELSMMMNVLATMNENISREDLDSLRGHCVEEVKRINGCLSLNDAYRWQNG